MNDLIDKIQSEVEDFRDIPFLAPCLGGNKIRVRMPNGLLLTLSTWYLPGGPYAELNTLAKWRATNKKTAVYMRQANLQEQLAYLDLFPTTRLLITEVKHEDRFTGVMSRVGTGKIRIEGEVEVISLTRITRPALFEEVEVCFDGSIFFFKRIILDDQHELYVQAKLRDEFLDRAFSYDADAVLATKYLRPEHLVAFDYAWNRVALSAEEVAQKMLGDAVSHAGGTLKKYEDDVDTYKVTMEVDGIEQSPIVISKDMDIISAGVCLSGDDQIFDLQSLVGVLREGKSEW